MGGCVVFNILRTLHSHLYQFFYPVLVWLADARFSTYCAHFTVISPWSVVHGKYTTPWFAPSCRLRCHSFRGIWLLLFKPSLLVISEILNFENIFDNPINSPYSFIFMQFLASFTLFSLSPHHTSYYDPPLIEVFQKKIHNTPNNWHKAFNFTIIVL